MDDILEQIEICKEHFANHCVSCPILKECSNNIRKEKIDEYAMPKL